MHLSSLSCYIQVGDDGWVRIEVGKWSDQRHVTDMGLAGFIALLDVRTNGNKTTKGVAYCFQLKRVAG